MVYRVSRTLFITFFFILIGPAGISHCQLPPPSLSNEQLLSLEEVIDKAVKSGKTPGAVVLVGNRERVIYRKAFGYRSLQPAKVPMTEDTIFDIASLTKVVATTTAIMQLSEKGDLELDSPAARYWPEFKVHGKSAITVRHLLTHYSGLRAALDCSRPWSGYDRAMEMILGEKPVFPPGTEYIYSDINFEILGELIRRISGKTLDEYSAEHIFTPLGMKDTGFRPSENLKSRIAPTSYKKGKMLLGKVNDPTAYNMGGVSGHAGLFSTADDLSIFSRMLLNGGELNGVRVLEASSVDEMTLPQSPPGKSRMRGLGWDIDSPFVSNRDETAQLGSYDHLGYTGTALWIDPVTGTYIILLTNRLHPYGRGDVKELRTQVKSIVAEANGPFSAEQIIAARPSLRQFETMLFSGGKNEIPDCNLRTGIDVLAAEKFEPLSGLSIGLITNHTGLDISGRRTLDLLHNTPGLKLKAIFSPEHGLFGTEDKKVPSIREPVTGLPVYSLYGSNKRPEKKTLEGLDVIVFDIQDAGARFYTYITTLAYAMEAAAEKGIKFYVLDRPNPINASSVQGPVLDTDLISFTGYFPLPVRHGMTVGELARMFNAENRIGAHLEIIKMNGYQRNDWYDQTCLKWVNPSPNLRSITQAALYPGVALIEGTNVSVGRGTETPFEVFGASWIKAEELAAYLNERMIPGVRFIPEAFTPDSYIYKNRICHGVRINLEDRTILDSPALGIEIISALYKLYPKDFQIDKTLGMIGSRKVLQAIKGGEDPRGVYLLWKEPLARFREMREKYLLY
jgi:uncharacterized protein YbbC (DUF1343 family)/CubicO group peptidase (beta-lactamase class C family)